MRKIHFYLQFALAFLPLCALGCASLDSGNAQQDQEQTIPMEGARVLVGNGTAVVYIPIAYLTANGKNIDQGLDVFGIRFEQEDAGLFGRWSCDVHIKNDDGLIPHWYFDEMWEPGIDGLYDDSFTDIQSLTEDEQRVVQRLRQTCHSSVFVAVVTFDGKNIVMSELGPSLGRHSPNHVTVYLRMDDGVVIQSMVEVEYDDTIPRDPPGIYLH